MEYWMKSSAVFDTDPVVDGKWCDLWPDAAQIQISTTGLLSLGTGL